MREECSEKVVVADLYRTVECGSSAVRKEEATGYMTAVRKTWSSAKVTHGSPNARSEPRMFLFL